MSRHRRWVGYVSFAIIVSGLSLYFSFPSETIRRYLEGLATEIAPAFSLKIEEVRPALPFGLHANMASLSHTDRPGINLFKAEGFMVKPSMKTLFWRKPALSFDCQAYGGRIDGVIASTRFNFAGPYRSDIQIHAVRLERYPIFKERLKRQCTGTLDGALTYRWEPRRFIGGSGQGSFSIVDGTVRFARPFLDINSLDFQRIDVKIVLKNEQISLNQVTFKGKKMKGRASGTIHLSPAIDRSNLDLKVSIKPLPDFFPQSGGAVLDAAKFLKKYLNKDHITLNIRGTIMRPRVEFH